MRIWIFTILMMLIGFAPSVYAQEAAEQEPSLEEQAIDLAARTDAVNMACGKETQLIMGYLQRFAKRGADYDMLKALELRAVQVFEAKVLEIVEGERPCDDVELLLEKFTDMKDLRDVSYRLGGIDPASIPSTVDFSGIEELFPKEE